MSETQVRLLHLLDPCSSISRAIAVCGAPLESPTASLYDGHFTALPDECTCPRCLSFWLARMRTEYERRARATHACLTLSTMEDIYAALARAHDDIDTANALTKLSDPLLVQLEIDSGRLLTYYFNLTRITAERDGINKDDEQGRL